MIKNLILLCLFGNFLAFANDDYKNDGYALDDVHNHDGTHVEGQENCGGNYMFPGDIARLGSHSFLILGDDGPEHLILDHRSGTPPHTYQFSSQGTRKLPSHGDISSSTERV